MAKRYSEISATDLKHAFAIGALKNKTGAYSLASLSSAALALRIISEPESCPDPVDFIVVHGGRGTTIHKRLYHALVAIKHKRVTTTTETPTIFIMTGERYEDSPCLSNRFGYVSCEFELALAAIEDLCQHVSYFEMPSLTIVSEGKTYTVRYHSVKAMYRTKRIDFVVLETSFDRERKLNDGKPATAANFEEAMLPLVYCKDALAGRTIYFVSHDIWQPRAKLKLQNLLPETKIVGNGPYNAERLITVPAHKAPDADEVMVLGTQRNVHKPTAESFTMVLDLPALLKEMQLYDELVKTPIEVEFPPKT